MKISVVLSSLAALALAVPAPAPAPAPASARSLSVAPRGSLNSTHSSSNFISFANQDLLYLDVINGLDLALLAQLSATNNLDIVVFQSLFQQRELSLGALLQFQQLQLVLELAQLGLFSGRDLSSLHLGGLNLGLLANIAVFDVGQLIDQSRSAQIVQIIQAAFISK